MIGNYSKAVSESILKAIHTYRRGNLRNMSGGDIGYRGQSVTYGLFEARVADTKFSKGGENYGK